ncbi:MAG: hypothetical protein ACYDBB_24085 [Armatimonadota bacterium]
MASSTIPAELIAHAAHLRAGQRERIACLCAALRERMRPFLQEDGTWQEGLGEYYGRVNLWLAPAFYEGDAADNALADRLIQQATIEAYDGYRFNIFQTNIACQLRIRYGHLMDDDPRAWCEQVITEGNRPFPGNAQSDYQFHGYNDNMPAEATKTLILGGELLGREDWLKNGLWKLRRLAGILSRRGMMSEYNSPTYSALTVHAIGSIAEYARHEEARELAAGIEQRIWTEMAAMWHPGARGFAGPHSRTYHADLANAMNFAKRLVWIVLGEEVTGLEPLHGLTDEYPVVRLYNGSDVYFAASTAWYASGDYHGLTPEIAALFLEKPDPFEVIATAEQGDSPNGPLKVTTNTAFLRDAYSLGTTAYTFIGGEHTTSLFITADNGSIAGPTAFTRYLVDGEVPGIPSRSTEGQYSDYEKDFYGHATAITVQHQASALVSYVPHRTLADREVSHLRLAWIMPTGLHQVDELRIGPQEITAWEGSFDARQWCGVRLGKALVAFRPLAYNAPGGEARPLTLHTSAHHAWLELTNYQGDPRQFEREELERLLNGMAVEVARSADYSDLATFLAELQAATAFEDIFFFHTRRLRYQRQALRDRAAVTLDLSYSTYSDGVALRTVNGRPQPELIWQATGIPAETLPFLGEGNAYIPPLGLPWDNLSVYWYPQPSAIHEHGPEVTL